VTRILISKGKFSLLLTIVLQSFLQIIIAMCGRTGFWGPIAKQHQCDDKLLGPIEKKRSDALWLE